MSKEEIYVMYQYAMKDYDNAHDAYMNGSSDNREELFARLNYCMGKYHALQSLYYYACEHE